MPCDDEDDDDDDDDDSEIVPAVPVAAAAVPTAAVPLSVGDIWDIEENEPCCEYEADEYRRL